MLRLIFLAAFLHACTADTIIDSTNKTIVLIQGLPCDDVINTDVIGKEAKTSWSQECDHLCSLTIGCQSYTWSRLNSKCQMYRMTTSVADHCYVQSLHDFWYDH